ncbi:50S ribosomal protein L11 methyltransferase [Desulfoferrobacter suflitae]|uniref:50S ribosomal protein L11 methyltransferase n=1 Tax=Desulfoferrobacter suflitae TaxID=2865782 RepID=UPI0021640654|nr:50S ribosomal protein L11 methyltransferase [Desulfoferrobacter suflitae]MCK8603342.1 50S ribosomal protein L11 methyltransferase [Desulfoferrobacter suflitae]
MKINLPEQLYVYECSGPASPETEPQAEGYLGIWPEVPYYYVFFERPADSPVRRWLLENGNGWCLRNTYQLDYAQWQQVSGRDHEVGPFVIQVGDHTDTAGGMRGKLSILINPGVVFGTGLHPTTRGCLLAVARLFEQSCIQTVVDFGTGTGILALACAKLGASRIIAVDCNPLAIRVALSNAVANGRRSRIELLVARDPSILKEPSDLLLLNLEWPCLRQLLRESEWAKYRQVVLSGFLKSQLPQLMPLIGDVCEINLVMEQEDWMTLVVAPKRPASDVG